MLSKDYISQLVSICSELDRIDLPHDSVAYEERLKLIEKISVLVKNDQKQSQKTIEEISQLLAHLQEVTDTRLNILEFAKNISPKT